MSATRAVVLLLLAPLVLAAGCSSHGAPGASGPSSERLPSAPASVTGGPTADAPASSGPSPSPVLEDGRHFGAIRSVNIEAGTLRFDLAYFLTGEAANEAAAERGDEVPVPNDVYIVNDNPKLRTLPISADLVVWVIDWKRHCCHLVRGEVAPFLAAFESHHRPWDARYQGRQAPYWITVRDGVVVRIEVQYLP